MSPTQTKVLAAVVAASCAIASVYFPEDTEVQNALRLAAVWIAGYLTRRHGDLAPLPGGK